ncbi:MAG: hypothetical protein M1825_004368 [Sarcosagium campestre]|nr:MAG: hypothetical protein M1825_004368 [Sarcosagium campestre]
MRLFPAPSVVKQQNLPVFSKMTEIKQIQASPLYTTQPMLELPRRRSVRKLHHFALTFLVLCLLSGWLWWSGPDNVLNSQVSLGIPKNNKVRLEAHIMSKCPDAKDCLHDLVVPAMQRVSDKVDFTLSFIGETTEHDDGVSCKHGPPECLGNMLELCAASLYPDPKIYLGFTMCLTRDYGDIPDKDLVQDCALEHSIDFDKLNACVSSDDGYALGLLRKSVERSAAANVTYSCTVRLNEEIRCIRDGGAWKNCEGGSNVDDLVRDVEQLYRQD